AFARGQGVWDALAQDLAQSLIETVRCKQVRDRTGEHDDVVGAFLDLAHALEIAQGGRDVFDADAEQRWNRDGQQLGELLQRLDFRDLALLKTIKRGARYAELAGNLVGAQAGAEPERLETVADVVEANGHEWRIANSRVANRE